MEFRAVFFVRCTAVLAGLMPALAFAQGSDPVVTLPPTIVTATRVPTPADRLPASVTVIDRATIEERGYVTLADALMTVPGMRLVQAGGIGQQASAFLRGAASRHVLVLLDGVPINDASEPNGAFDFGNELLGDIERIEIVRGPASAFYGSGALGGVINLVPRRATADGVQPFAELAGGSNSTVRGLLGAAGRADGFDWMFAGQSLSTRGSNVTPPRFLSNLGERDGFRGQLLTATLGYSFGQSRVDGLLRFRDTVIGLDDVPQDDPNYTGRNRNWMGFLRASTTLLDGRWTTTLRLSVTEDRRRYVNLPDAASGATADDRYRGRNMVLDWSNLVRVGDFGVLRDTALSFGASRSWEESDSAAGSAFFRTTVDAAQRSDALHLGAQGRFFDRLDVSLGLRHDAPHRYEGATTWRAGGVLALPEIASRLRVSAGTGYKAPSLFQRYGVIGSFFRGNPDLRPENSFSWEAGIETDFGRHVTASALYFDSHFRNLINYDPTFSTLTNVDRARIRGAELGLVFRLAPWLNATAAWTITEARDVATGEPLARRPRNVATLGLRIAPHPRLVISPELLLTGRSPEGAYARYANDGTSYDTRGYNKPGAVLNVTAQWRWSPQVAFFAEGRNLTGARYEPANGFVIPGRSFILGTRFGL